VSDLNGDSGNETLLSNFLQALSSSLETAQSGYTETGYPGYAEAGSVLNTTA
jgi:hypothetical protein